MTRKVKNVLLMVTNVGSTSLEQNSYEDEPFIDKAKYAMKLLVEKKLFLQPKDEIGIITMGDETSDNPEGMDYVKNYKDHLLVPNWEMLKYINNLNNSNKPCNWIEGLHVALNFIQREIIDPNYRVFLVIFNNFKEKDDDINSYDPDIIVNDIKRCDNIHLLFVGENPLDDNSWKKKYASFSEKFAMKIMKKCNGQYEQINSFINKRKFYIAPPVNATAWKFNLEIAEICIPCSSYVKVNENIKLESWKMKAINNEDLLNTSTDNLSSLLPSRNNTFKVVKEKLRLDAQRNEMTADEIINGYKFGRHYIPVSEEDEKAMKYEGGSKGMVIYGFVPQNDIKLEYWCGKGTRIIVPQSENDASAFYSLLRAMDVNKYVAIVRKVYAHNNLPKMGALFPRMADDEAWCLVHLELPYSDEIRFIEKKPIKSLSKNINEEQVKALDDWIDSMTVSYENLPYLNPGFFPNIPHQYHWNVMADRVLNPGNSLLPLPTYLYQYLIPPEQVKRQAKPHLDKLNKLFGWSNEQIVKKKQMTTVVTIEKSNPDIGVAIAEKNRDSFDKNPSDEGIFSPENIDIDTAELDNI
ncbi:uncharacterized protein LOC131665759 [Phymastichus coffea]|uniref:uncharacterized protein LOC131665759 n=1 Tax=Phymastichus coffea TaxID=108790 RepID=UPI00273B5D12|nr:uncharacterized protein LOC131665759 [Phymastichus coffea]